MNKKALFKAIAILLVFVMAFHVSSNLVFGAQATIDTKENKEVTGYKETSVGVEKLSKEDPITEKEAEVIGEDESKRELNTKYYKMSDGSTIVAVYPMNIHYEKDGKLEDIDNTIKLELESDRKAREDEEKATEESEQSQTEEVVDESTKQGTEEDVEKATEENTERQTQNVTNEVTEKATKEVSNEVTKQDIKEVTEKNIEKTKEAIVEADEVEENLQNTNNAFKINFSKNIKEVKDKKADKVKAAKDVKPIINISKGKYNIGFGLLNTNKTKATVENEESDLIKLKGNAKQKTKEEKLELKKVSSQINYKNIIDKIDLTYTLIGDKVKENIVINEKTKASEKFEFILNTGGLSAEKVNDEIIIYDGVTDHIIFLIDPFLMWDSKLEYSDKIETSLEEIEGGYKLTVIPDQEWLNSKDRVYPITIDPSISTSLERSQIEDAYIYEGDTENWTRGDAQIIRAGNSKPLNGNPVRGLVKFNLPQLGAGDQVIYANLVLHNYPKTTEWTPPANPIQLDAHKMTQDWTARKNTQEEVDKYPFWENLKNSYDSKVVDYITYKFDFNNPNVCDYYIFNITSIAKDWYTTRKQLWNNDKRP